MKKLAIWVVFILLSFSSVTYADCIYNGVSYPTGTMVNGLTCQEDGSWGD
ncbi:MAG: hypothetical protein P8010_01990 [Desulfosarcinaceae bacterium]|jgi:hypothetical protein